MVFNSIFLKIHFDHSRNWQKQRMKIPTYLPALKFFVRKEFFQDELGYKVKLGQNFAKNLLKKIVLF